MAEVVLRDLIKIYPGDRKNPAFEAVKGIDLHVRDGEFMVLVGPSGCAKSTTLRMVAGLEEITGGEIEIGGRVVNAVPPKDRDIAMVFQNYALYPHMSVRENMAFGLTLRKTPRDEIEKRVAEAAEMLGLEDLLERKPKAMSGGQRQRVALGRAIVRKPKVFLFDEPLSNLDAKMRVSMRTEIARLHARLKTTMLYVTHDQTEAMTLGDRITVMESGAIMQVDAPLAVYAKPANRFVAGFIGSPQMNFVEGRLGRNGDGFVLETAGGGGGKAGSLPLAGEPGIAAGALEGREIVLGIRPEHLEVAGAGGDPGAHVRTRALITEPMGAETYVHVETESGRALIAREHGICDIETGSEVWVRLDLGRAHFFDARSGDVIVEGGE